MPHFNEDTRVKFPATVQFMRLGYEYQSKYEDEIDFNTKIFKGRFHRALERINKRSFTDEEIEEILKEITTLISNKDMGKSFYHRLILHNDIKLVDFDDYLNNDFAVTCELPFSPKKNTEEGSFRPDVVALINGMPLGFLEVKIPNNQDGIQKEFRRMLDDRLKNPDFVKFFNLIQFVTFSNNLDYESSDDTVEPEQIRQGSFYSTPNGFNTYFNFFRETEKTRKKTGFKDIAEDEIRHLLKDNKYSESEYDAPEFQTNLDSNSPCNRFITSFFEPERIIFLLQYGFCYVEEKDDFGNPITNKHIMRYPQFFASRAIVDRLNEGEKSGIIWHTQGSGKTELAAYSNRILRDYYAKKGISTRFFFVVDRIDLLRQSTDEFLARGLSVTNVENKKEFVTELNRPIDKTDVTQKADLGSFTVVNVQKIIEDIPQAKNDYDAKVQRVFFIDECHRSYRQKGEYYKNLKLCDLGGVFIALTGTPLLSKSERSNLKFGEYIHKYFYGESIADGYTLRIKRESIDKIKRVELRENLDLDEPDNDKDNVLLSEDFKNDLCKFIADDFRRFRLMHQDNTIGGMIVCSSNEQAKAIGKWFDENKEYTKGLSTGVVITDVNEPMQAKKNKELQREFKKDNGKPDILIVNLMLTTGYDVHRLKKMYLLRNAHSTNLLQTISRVNRPYKNRKTGKTYQYGYITDFVDINEEFERTIGSYIDELERDANIDDEGSLKGVVISPADIYKKYQQHYIQIQALSNCEVNYEVFSQSLNSLSTKDLYSLRKHLQICSDCYMELKLSGSNFADEIRNEDLKKWLKLTNNRIHLRNLNDGSPIDMLAILNDDEIIDVVYEFVKTSSVIMNLGALANPDDNPDLRAISKTITNIQRAISDNHNRNQSTLIKLDKVLSDIFKRLDIHDIDELPLISADLQKALEELHRINEENARLSEKYDGKYAFVATYTMLCEKYPDTDTKDLEEVMTVIFNAVKKNTDKNYLLIQGRQGFIDYNRSLAVDEFIDNGLWGKLNMNTEWLNDLLNNLYTNLQLI